MWDYMYENIENTYDNTKFSKSMKLIKSEWNTKN